MAHKLQILSIKDGININIFILKLFLLFLIFLLILISSYFTNILVAFTIITVSFVIMFYLFSFLFSSSDIFQYHIYLDVSNREINAINNTRFIKSSYIINFNNVKKIIKYENKINRSIILLFYFRSIINARFFPMWQYKCPIFIELNQPIKPIVMYRKGLASISCFPLPEDHKEGTINRNPSQIPCSKYFIISDMNNTIMEEYIKYKQSRR